MEDLIGNATGVGSALMGVVRGAPQMHETMLSVKHETTYLAGLSIKIEASVQCLQSCQVMEGSLCILDDRGEKIAEFNGECCTIELMIKAPDVPGFYTFQAIYEAPKESNHMSCATPFSFEVEEHCIIVSALGTKSPVVKGEVFSVTIGACCLGGCSLVGTRVSVSNGSGEQIAQGLVGDELWPGTTDIYCAKLELLAPQEEGIYRWYVNGEPSATKLPHRVQSGKFSFSTICSRPEHKVTITVVTDNDNVYYTRRDGAGVFLGSWQTETDENGVAVLEVSKGTQMLFVSKTDYALYTEEITVNSDMELTIRLDYVAPVY